MLETSAAIRMGTPGPKSLGVFWLRKALHTHLGMSLDEFRQLPWQEAEDTIFFIQMINREEQERARRANSGRV